ncbi:MAG: hypothetical protein L6Q38_09995, partial [Nitrospira sp.]|nr:hypothetical protein [Nitrospira sp.]
ADPAKPLPENVAEWLAGLSGSDMRKARTSARYLVDAWDDPAVQDALRALAKGQGEGAARALELLAVAELRNSGVIVFNNKVPGKKMAAWAMNPDGSRRRTLLPAELEAKDWWTLWPGTGNHVLLVDWEKRGLCDYLLEEHMVVPVDAEPVNQVAVRKGTEQIVYMRMHNRDGSPGALHIYDLAAHRHLPVPKVLVGVDIDDLSLSPDGRRISYLRLDPDGAWEGNRSIRVSDLESGEEKKLFGLTGEHQACGDGIEWSADGKYVSCSTYQQKEGRYQKLAYVIEVDSGRHWNLLEGYRGSERLVWSTQGARLAFWAERVAQGAKELVLAAKSDDGWIIRKLDPPEGSETSWLQWTADNRLLVRARDKSWLIDPDNPASAVDVPVADGIYLGDGQVLNGTSGPWFLAEADGVKGCDDRQIVLISRDGKHVVPITNLPCGASGPHFYPNK